MRKLVAFMILLATLGSAIFADQADAVFAALVAKNDVEVARILQNLALTADFEQLDRVQAKNYELFGTKYFSGDFVSKIIFAYPKTASAAVKIAQAAKGSNNPNKKGSWQWSIWDMDRASATLAGTKEVATQKTLSPQIDSDVTALVGMLTRSGLQDTEKVTVGLYLNAQNVDLAKREMTEDDIDSLTGLIKAQAQKVLRYLFKAWVPLPTNPPTSLTYEDWKSEVDAFVSYLAVVSPFERGQFETVSEFGERAKEWDRLVELLLTTELSVPAKLSLGAYDFDNGYFHLSVALPLIVEDLSYSRNFEVRYLDRAMIRYYLDRKAASFFKDKGFNYWAVTAVLAASEQGVYELKEIKVSNGKDQVIEGLWGFSITPVQLDSGTSLFNVENYFKGNALLVNGTRVVGGGNASVTLPADGTFTIASASDKPGIFINTDVINAIAMLLPHTIKIASQSPLSGGMSAVGTDIKNGALLAIEQLSGSLSELGFEVELAPFDDQGNPDTGVANAKIIVADLAILAVVGHYNSGVQIPSSEEYHAARLVNISPANTNPKVTERGYKEVNRICGRDDVQGIVGALFAASKGINSAYVLHDKTAYGQGIAEHFKRKAEALGIEVLGFEGTEEKANFDSILSPILAAKPQVIYFGGIFDQAAVLFKQARQKGYAGMFLSDDGFDSTDAAKIGGDSLLKGAGTYFSTVSGPASVYPGTAKFIADFKAKFNSEPQPFAAQSYDCAAIALKAIENAAVAAGKKMPARADVTTAVRALKNFPGITGPVNFNAKGDLVKAKYFIIQVTSADPAGWSSNKIDQVLEVEPPE